MSRLVVTDELISRIGEMYAAKSNNEIAEELQISVWAVKKVLKENNFVRSHDDKCKVRSRTRTELVKAERRRAIFGFDQKTDIKVFTNRERNSLKYRLRRKGYRFLSRGDTTAYYDDGTERIPVYEERGNKLGLKFRPLEVQYN